MDRNDGGPAIDLDELRAALKLIGEAIREADRAMPTPLNRRGESTRHPVHHAKYAGELRQASKTVAAALTELTTRRARDAEVAALVEMAQLVYDECDAHNDFAIDAKRRLRIAIAPFTGAKP